MLGEIQHNLRYGICNLAVTYVYENEGIKSKMITQLLYGETFEIIKTNQPVIKEEVQEKIEFFVSSSEEEFKLEPPSLVNDKKSKPRNSKTSTKKTLKEKEIWFYIRPTLDPSFEGWVYSGAIQEIDKESFEKSSEIELSFSTNILDIVNSVEDKKYIQNITMGALVSNSVYLGHKFLGGRSNIENFDINLFESFGSLFLNAPYLSGGKTILGIDSQGLIQIIYRVVLGISLPSNLEVLYDCIERDKLFLEGLIPGDIVFFKDEKNKLVSSGLVISSEKVLHIYKNKVCINFINQHGVFESSKDPYIYENYIVKSVFNLD